MTPGKEVRELIKKIAGGASGGTPAFITAEVKDLGDETCTVERNGLKLTDVRYNAVEDGNENNLLIKPAIGSMVLLADLSGGLYRDLVIISYSRVSTISINRGTLGGLCNVLELKTQLDKLTTRVDGIIHALKNSATGSQDGGAAYKTAIVLALNLLTDKENFANIEDTKIKH